MPSHTLLDALGAADGGRAALILPDTGERVSYAELQIGRASCRERV